MPEGLLDEMEGEFGSSPTPCTEADKLGHQYYCTDGADDYDDDDMQDEDDYDEDEDDQGSMYVGPYLLKVSGADSS